MEGRFDVCAHMIHKFNIRHDVPFSSRTYCSGDLFQSIMNVNNEFTFCIDRGRLNHVG